MKMTEKMKRELKGSMEKEEVELSDEELDGAAGGDDMDEDLRRLLWKSRSVHREIKSEWAIDYNLPWTDDCED